MVFAADDCGGGHSPGSACSLRLSYASAARRPEVLRPNRREGAQAGLGALFPFDVIPDAANRECGRA
jgi:hypothetical protein